MRASSMAQRLRSPWVTVSAVVIVIIALGSFWFFHTYEKKAFQEYVEGSPAARHNPLLAAQRYLQATGKQAIACHGIAFLSTLPPPKGALLIYRMPGGLTRSVNDALFDWAEAGGHLLFVPGRHSLNAGKKEDILSRLGARIFKKQDKSSRSSRIAVKSGPHRSMTGKSAAKISARHRNGYHPYTMRLDIDIDHRPIHLQYFGSPLLTDTNHSAVQAIGGSYRIIYQNKADRSRKDNNTIRHTPGKWLLDYKVGAGRITVLSEDRLFANRKIGDYDHAFFLSWLLRNDHTVRLLYSSEAEGLPAILWTKMPLFCLSLLVLLGLGLWRLQKRSGTLVGSNTEQQLNLLAHIEASGRFGWRTNRVRAILAANRKAVLHQWSERKLGLKQGGQNGQIPAEALAAAMGLTKQDVLDAFRLRVEGEQDLITTSRALQKIHQRLHGGESTKDDRRQTG